MAKLYLISQNFNEEYDTYDSAVVVSTDEDSAKAIHPSGDNSAWSRGHTWAPVFGQVTAQCIGEAADDLEVGSVVLASFNAG